MISDRARRIEPSATLAVTEKANQLKKEGKDVLSFGAGEPDFHTPDNIKEAAKKALDENFTYYTAASGIPELKKAICEKLKRENSLEYSAENIIISNGGKHALYNAFQALLNPGDEVLLGVPYWVSYVEQIRMADGVPVLVQTDSLKPTAAALREKLTEKTKIILLNSPSNPAGTVIHEDELREIADLAVDNNILVISDEVYEHFIYEGRHKSIASFNENIKKLTVTINAASKTYSMTGWRIGYAAAEKDIIAAMSALQSHSTSNPCSISQKAALEALTGSQKSVEIMRKSFQRRRNLMVRGLNRIPWVRCRMPEGAFYAFPDISNLKLNSEELCLRLLEEKLVAAVPGSAFGAEGFIRMSYACSEETIKQGVARIREFVEDH